MKTNLLILLVIGLLGYGITYLFYNQTPSIPEQTKALPAFSFTDLGGKTHQSKDFAGKIIILNFWATWGPPCIKEFPDLMQNAQQNKEDVILIALSSDLEKSDIETFLQKQAIPEGSNNILIAQDTENLTQTLFEIYRLPETLIFDPQQTLSTKLIGADWSAQDLQNIIQTIKPTE